MCASIRLAGFSSVCLAGLHRLLPCSRWVVVVWPNLNSGLNGVYRGQYFHLMLFVVLITITALVMIIPS